MSTLARIHYWLTNLLKMGGRRKVEDKRRARMEEMAEGFMPQGESCESGKRSTTPCLQMPG